MTNAQVTEAWATQRTKEGKGLHISFQGPTLRSYSTAVGWISIKHKVVFFPSSSMSITTSGHVSQAWSSVNLMNKDVLCIWTPAFRKWEASARTPARMIKEAAQQLASTYPSLYRKRSHLAWAIEDYSRTREKIIAAAMRLGYSIPDIPKVGADLRHRVKEMRRIRLERIPPTTFEPIY